MVSSANEAPRPLTAAQVYHHCPPEQFDFDTTEALADLDLPCGQERAVRALEFGSGIQRNGFNIFALGPAGTGRHELVRRFLDQRANEEEPPPDWCYVFDFRRPDHPRAIRLPSGEGRTLRQDMERLIDELRTSIPAAFESEEYQGRLQELQEAMARRQHEGIREIQESAREHDIALLSTPNGFTFAPMRDGEVIEPKEYQNLPEETRKRLEARVEDLQKQLQQTIQQIPRIRKEFQDRIRELNEEMVQFTLGGPMSELRERWTHVPAVIEHLDAVREQVVEYVDAFRSDEGHQAVEGLLNHFRINLLVDHAESSGAPVIYEDLPNHQHLTGLIEHRVRHGALHTDFSLVRAGALHHASGGYLILDARRVLTQPMAWDSLKRVLFSGEVRIESLERLYGLISTASLQPDPIPVAVKVVLVGDRLLYYLLCEYDPDFLELFKVEADFEDDVERSVDAYGLYARMLARMARDEALQPLDRGAVARIIEHASRLADDQRKLTAHDRQLRDLLMEADHWSRQAGAGHTRAEHVEQAIDERIRRADRVRQRGLEQIHRGTVLISTTGQQVAQVNGLSVLQLGALRFGRPVRITATARPGRGQIVDIEREAKLGGRIHSKGVMILARFLASHYGGDAELSLSASIAFEQSYGGIEGDSASVAETCALLSAIARIPLHQTLAVTGSVNQHGEVQAIGGVNEKVEGFFDACLQNGGVDGQGVALPAANVDNLMVRRDVREAVADGRFHIYPIRTMDEAIALLSGLPAGQPDDDGGFPDASFNRAVADRLADFTARTRRHGRAEEATPDDGARDDDA